MRISAKSLDCRSIYSDSKRLIPFRYIQVEAAPGTNSNDRAIINTFLDQATDLASKVNSASANDAAYKRPLDRLVRNAFAGLLSEWLWKSAMNHLLGVEFLHSTEYLSPDNQIDLLSTTGLSVEVRSSFPRKGVEFALCHPTHQFDVIGPYSNEYKSGEKLKDFYVRCLFPYEESEFLSEIKNENFHAYLTGGATKEMFANSKLTSTKSMTPLEDLILNQVGPSTSYLVIPFSNSLDTLQIAEKLGYIHRGAWEPFEID
jgi:hypothetical protein